MEPRCWDQEKEPNRAQGSGLIPKSCKLTHSLRSVLLTMDLKLLFKTVKFVFVEHFKSLYVNGGQTVAKIHLRDENETLP